MQVDGLKMQAGELMMQREERRMPQMNQIDFDNH